MSIPPIPPFPSPGNVDSLYYTDRIAVLCDINSATTDTDEETLLILGTDTGMINLMDVVFWKDTDPSNPYTNVSGNLGQFWRAKCGFRILEKCTIQNINVNIQVQVLNASGDVEGIFPLETWNNPTADAYNGIFTDMRIKESQPFFLEDESPFIVKSILRDSSVDGAGYYGYELNYGFQLGFSWWQQLNDFAKQYETYSNQYWPVYSQNKVISGSDIQTDGGTASIKFIVTWDILNNVTGVITQFNRTCSIVCNDEEYTNTITGVITTEDAIFADDLQQQISDDVQTQVIGTFNGTGIGTAPIGYGIVAEMAIYYQDGSINRYDRVTSESSPLEDSLWIASLSITIVTNDQVVVTGTLDISKELINRIYVQFGYGSGDGVTGLLTDAGIQIQTDSGLDILVD